MQIDIRANTGPTITMDELNVTVDNINYTMDKINTPSTTITENP